MIHPHVQTIFCDDIRHEVNGKFSCIGIYSNSLFVESFPITLPKLCVAVSVVLPLIKPVEQIKLVVRLDDEVLTEEITPEEIIESIGQAYESTPEELRHKKLFITRLMVEFSPLVLKASGDMKVRAYVDDDVLHGVSLTIDQKPQEKLAQQ